MFMYMYSYVVLDANNIVEKTIIIYVYIYIYPNISLLGIGMKKQRNKRVGREDLKNKVW